MIITTERLLEACNNADRRRAGLEKPRKRKSAAQG
jgi:hypothetical protein